MEKLFTKWGAEILAALRHFFHFRVCSQPLLKRLRSAVHAHARVRENYFWLNYKG
jgi:hypothetical protein